MKISVARACAWVSLGLLTYAPLAAAQTVERLAGGGIVNDMPALDGPVQPLSVSVGPDGSIYANDINGCANAHLGSTGRLSQTD